jgi:TolA-binding protein
MQNRVKLTKRQIKEDKFTTFMLNAKSQFMESWQFYVIGVVAVIVIGAGAIYFANYKEARSQDASARFAQAMASYRNQQNQIAIVALNEIVEDYGGEDVAEQATFLLGKLNYEVRNYPEAMRFFEMYLSKYRSSKLDRAASLAGLAVCNENQSELETAMEKYLAAYNEYPDGPLAGDYELSVLRLALKTGDMASARVRLESIQGNYEGSELAKTAVRIFHELGQS